MRTIQPFQLGTTGWETVSGNPIAASAGQYGAIIVHSELDTERPCQYRVAMFGAYGNISPDSPSVEFVAMVQVDNMTWFVYKQAQEVHHGQRVATA